MNFRLKLNYDDQLEDVIEKVNECLEAKDLVFELLPDLKDGIIIYELKKLEE